MRTQRAILMAVAAWMVAALAVDAASPRDRFGSSRSDSDRSRSDSNRSRSGSERSRFEMGSSRVAPAPAQPPAPSPAPVRPPSRPESGPSRSSEWVPSGDAGFDAFRLVMIRNIFDAERRPYVPRPTTRTEEARPPRVDQIAVLGSWINRTSTATETLVFLSGTLPQYNTIARAGNTVGEFHVMDVRTDFVQLKNGSQIFVVPVGGGLRRREGGPWELALALEAPPMPMGAPVPAFGPTMPAAMTSPAAAPVQSPQAPAGDSSPDEILKRLMERRRQEESK
ncbi:MAG: hypothetical protein N3D11_06240 [Candidatus Sumerlaeia bacterium]|nr:hypothetical protein [Candidatus Sumerlaeia bacterium]